MLSMALLCFSFARRWLDGGRIDGWMDGHGCEGGIPLRVCMFSNPRILPNLQMVSLLHCRPCDCAGVNAVSVFRVRVGVVNIHSYHRSQTSASYSWSS